MEDEPFPNALRVLRHTNCGHGSLLLRSHWCMRMLYLGILSDRVQALPFDTSLSVVSFSFFFFVTMKTYHAPSSALIWRRTYFLFVIVFPVLAFTAHLVALLKTHSVRRTDDMHCDNTYPLWCVSCRPVRSLAHQHRLGLVFWVMRVLPYSCLLPVSSFPF